MIKKFLSSLLIIPIISSINLSESSTPSVIEETNTTSVVDENKTFTGHIYLETEKGCYFYSVNEEDKTACINSYQGNDDEITLPTKIRDYTVISINCMFDSNTLKRINIPTAIPKIEGISLDCPELQEIRITNGVNYL